MITIIAINEKDEQVKLTVKSIALIEVEEFIGIDEESAEKLVAALEQYNNHESAAKLKKLLVEPESEEG